MKKYVLTTVLLLSTILLTFLGYKFYSKYYRHENNNRITYGENESKKSFFEQEQDERNDLVKKSDRIVISSDKIRGSLSLLGARFDDISMLKYKESVGNDSQNVEVLSPSGMKSSQFFEFGWYTKDNSTKVPDSNTTWNVNEFKKDSLNQNETLVLSWKNDENVEFRIKISFDEDYMFFVEQSVTNHGQKDVYLKNYALVNKSHDPKIKDGNSILHQGCVGVVENSLEEYTYDKLKDDKLQQFKNKKINWLGITDKYWLVSIAPDNSIKYDASFRYRQQDSYDKVQTDIATQFYKLPNNGSELALKHMVFVGPKELNLLDKYQKKYDISLFDRAVDFGWLYVITKPIFLTLTFINQKVGNFGISILIITVMLKILTFGISKKSYRSMQKLKDLQPKIESYKSLYSSDKLKLNQKILELYKSEKVNPFSGIFSILIQIPIFFAIYKVLYVTIEMRHAPFYGWIRDLSAKDPTNIFNLFGMIDLNLPGFLHVGAWPILMSISMYLQQRTSPAPSDPAQAQLMKFLPLIFLFVFNSFPAGLLIYWTWSNLLSIVQQYFVNKK